ncbi:hypothetical protein [uncultured Shewanella sp.]|uniref:hypothetical protein n=1 Tax=uncultured Shewanella sp. TaxID=173975 RepID=UPI0026301014|nr:hypothetical protein [uncultured Shewanella sp.]
MQQGYMQKDIFVPVLASVLTAVILGFSGTLSHFFGALTVPEGAVVAFDSMQCPKGWKDFKPAYGHFIRGIDDSGTLIDPDGKRKPASLQADAIKRHTHVQRYADVKGHFSPNGYDFVPHVTKTGQMGTETTFFGGSETRPKNIALLYCIKT